MLGIRKPSDVTIEYCAMLMQEYRALDCAQVFTILKSYGQVGSRERKQIIRELCQRQYAIKTRHTDDRTYFIARKGIALKGLLYSQVLCFWVALGYLDKVDSHFAAGTPSSLISMVIGGRDYSIIHAPSGKERMCSYLMEKGGVTRYFILVDNISQIPLIKGDQIHAFATIDERRQVKFYTV